MAKTTINDIPSVNDIAEAMKELDTDESFVGHAQLAIDMILDKLNESVRQSEEKAAATNTYTAEAIRFENMREQIAYQPQVTNRGSTLRLYYGQQFMGAEVREEVWYDVKTYNGPPVLYNEKDQALQVARNKAKSEEEAVLLAFYEVK